MSQLTPAGWYPDPQVPGQNRYWDGAQWTEHTAPLAGTPGSAEPRPAAPPAYETPAAPDVPAASQAPQAYQPPQTYQAPAAYQAPATYQVAAPAAGRLGAPQWLSTAAMALVALAAFLPWVSAFGISRSGLDADGVITLVLALAGGALFVVGHGLIGTRKAPGLGTLIPSLVLGALVLLIALIDTADAGSLAAFGLYLTLLAGLAWVAGDVWQLVTRRAPAA